MTARPILVREPTAEEQALPELANREAVHDWNTQQKAEQATEARNERYFEDGGWTTRSVHGHSRIYSL